MREMKDSGIEWIGSVPFSFDSKKLKYLVEKRFGGCWGSDEKEDGNNVLCIRIADFDFNTQTVKSSASTIRNYTKTQLTNGLLKNGDIIVEKSGGGDKTPVGRTVIYDKAQFPIAMFANFCDAIRPTNNISNKYLAYCLKSFYQNMDMHLFFNQTTGLQNLNMLEYMNAKMPFPSLPEQQRIVAFLDGKCFQIDEISKKIQEEIDTLEEYKKSVITEAVTKGLDPDVEMKDSGYEWLGMIPTHWILQKGKYLFVQKNEKGNNISLQLLSPTQNYGVIPQSLYEELSGFNAVKLNDKTDFNQLKTVHKGAYVISLRSFQGGFEYSEYEGVVSPAYQVFYSVVNIDDRYYKFFFKTQIFIEKMNSYTMSLRDGKNIAFVDFGNTYIPYPPKAEQRQIADYLDEKTSQINASIDAKKHQLEVIEEYKKSLIYEYVTGKKEVPNANS